MSEQEQGCRKASLINKIIFGIIAVFLAVLTVGFVLRVNGYDLLKDFDPFEKRSFFAKKCLWILEDSLKIPRSLEIISVTESIAPLSARAALAARSETGYDKSVYIVYEASNAYGVQIRDTALCNGNSEDRVTRFASDGKYTDSTILKAQDISTHFRVVKK